MSRRLLCLFAASLLVVGLLAGCPESFEDGCDATCAVLEECRLLPSALGVDRANCEARCEQSPQAVRDTVKECTKLKPSDGGNDGGNCPTKCSNVSSCLLGKYPNDGILGEATLIVVPSFLPSEQAASDSLRQCEAEESGARVDPIDAGFDGAAPWPADWCNRHGSSSGRAFVLRDGVYTWSEVVACEQMLATGATFDRILPGELSVGIELTGRTVDSDAGPGLDFCHVFRAKRLLLGAGKVTRVPVWLPDPVRGTFEECARDAGQQPTDASPTDAPAADSSVEAATDGSDAQ